MTQSFQEGFYGASVDYDHGSPHLAHAHLRNGLVEALRRELVQLKVHGLPLRVLEIGAGHGGFTEPVLASGCSVTAVEMSRPSLEVLRSKFASNPSFASVFDREGKLDDVPDEFSMILCVAVLHHIPDYAAFLSSVLTKLRPGGTFLALQDPLWYPRLNARTRLTDRVGYLGWRARQGDLRSGLKTLQRRIRQVYDESSPRDMVEYHVVRQGVDEQLVSRTLSDTFTRVEIVPYWSNQSSVTQRFGERAGLKNTFFARATGRKNPNSQTTEGEPSTV